MIIHGKKSICVTVVLVAAVTTGVWAEAPYQVAWKRQIGTSMGDYSESVTVDASGNIYISGYTDGDLGGPNAGSGDAYLRKLDSGGNEIWTTQIGSSGNDASNSVAVDAWGNAYISGYTWADMGGPNAGFYDAFLSKFNSDGNEIWTSQIGTDRYERSESVAVDSFGNAYISGYTSGDLGGRNAGGNDAFLSKFDSGGNEVWTAQIGTGSGEISYSVAVDASSNIYISGRTSGNLGGTNPGKNDAFLGKFDSDGNEVWMTQIGASGDDQSFSVAVDASGNSYIGGATWGDLGGPYTAGVTDAFLSKFDSDGNEIWTAQIGTSDYDAAESVAVDAFGNAYISGYTQGDLGGPNAGGVDAFLSKFDSDGNLLWTTQIGSSEWEFSFSVAVDSFGNAYISGKTEGDLGGPNVGGHDAFLVKYEVPEPATLSFLALGGLAVLRKRRKR